METRRSAGNTRRRILNELGQIQGGEPLIHAHASSPAQQQNGNISVANGSLNSSIQDESGMMTNNMSNILNGSGFERKSSAEEELIRIRGRKKRKSAPNLRDLSPASLATIKSPMKQPTNEDIAYFLRSPTPKKAPQPPMVMSMMVMTSSGNRKRAHQSDSSLMAKMKRTRKSLEIEFGAGLPGDDLPKSKPTTPANVNADQSINLTEAKTESGQAKEENVAKNDVQNNSVKGDNGSILKQESATNGMKTPKSCSIKKSSSSSNKKKLMSPMCRESPRKNLRRSTNIAS